MHQDVGRIAPAKHLPAAKTAEFCGTVTFTVFEEIAQREKLMKTQNQPFRRNTV
jgi:hypothetical protein